MFLFLLLAQLCMLLYSPLLFLVLSVVYRSPGAAILEVAVLYNSCDVGPDAGFGAHDVPWTVSYWPVCGEL